MPAFLVMEAACCHDGDLDKARACVDLAAEIGADACKFQWVSTPARLAERRRVSMDTGPYALLHFPAWWLDVLRARCVDRGVQLMCTAYLPEDVHVVAPYVDRFKVSSFESTDAHFLLLHAEFRKPLIASAGLGRGARVRKALRQYVHEIAFARRDAGDLPPVDVLHCVSAYPCPDDQANIATLRQESFEPRHCSGYSDHTRHPWAGALAVAAGARVVEFHARLSDTDPANPDYAVSRTPDEAREYVAHIRKAEALLGTGRPEVMPAEAPMVAHVVAP